jgi:hypothetical protein
MADDDLIIKFRGVVLDGAASDRALKAAREYFLEADVTPTEAATSIFYQEGPYDLSERAAYAAEVWRGASAALALVLGVFERDISVSLAEDRHAESGEMNPVEKMATEPEVLYHYCSVAALLSILQNRSIHLSSLKLSNDSMEGRHPMQTMMRMASTAKLSSDARERLESLLRLLDRRFDSLGFCLSEKGDLLSQWRGYADDAKGASIGFSRKVLETCKKGRLLRVDYDVTSHERRLSGPFEKLKHLAEAHEFEASTLSGQTTWEAKSRKTADGLIESIVDLVPILFQLKESTFEEEQEWRLLTAWNGDRPDMGFRASSNRIEPFLNVPFDEFDGQVIVELKIGPQNFTPYRVVQALTKSAGLADLKISRSLVTYRGDHQ